MVTQHSSYIPDIFNHVDWIYGNILYIRGLHDISNLCKVGFKVLATYVKFFLEDIMEGVLANILIVEGPHLDARPWIRPRQELKGVGQAWKMFPKSPSLKHLHFCIILIMVHHFPLALQVIIMLKACKVSRNKNIRINFFI